MLDPNIPMSYWTDKIKLFVKNNDIDLIAYAYILFLAMLLYRLIMFLVYEIIFKKKIFLKLKKNFVIKSFIQAYIEERKKILFFLIKPATLMVLHHIWIEKYIHNYKYHIILAFTILISILYNSIFSFFKKRDSKELRSYLKILNKSYYDKVWC